MLIITKNNIKPFKSYAEQSKLLQERHLVIRNKFIAEHYLSEYSYYTLSNGIGRNYSHLKNPNDKSSNRIFNKGISLNYLIALHDFDQKVRSILFPQILNIEMSLKTKLSYIIGRESNYAISNHYHIGYLNSKYYSCNLKNFTLRKLRNMVKGKVPKHKYISKPLRHYMKEYNNIPSWILTTNLTFGTVSHWYKILNSKYQMEIIIPMLRLWNNKYSNDLKPWRIRTLINKCLNILVKFRNACAHGDIISFVKVNIYKGQNKTKLDYEEMLSELLLGYSDLSDKYGLVKRGDFNITANLYSCILAIILLTDDRKQLITFLNGVKSLFKDSAKLSVTSKVGIPKDAYLRIDNFMNKELFY